MIYEGNLIIEKDDKNDYSGITEITGDLSIRDGVKVNLSAVQTIGGDLSIRDGVKVNLSAVQTIGGDLYIYKDAKVNLSALQTIGGDLYIYKDAKVNLSAVQTIGGYLSIRDGAKANLSALQTIGGDLYIYKDVKVNLSAVHTIGRDLYIYNGAKANLSKDVKLNPDEAKSIVFNSFLHQGYVLADRILTKLITTKTNKDNTVYKTQKIGSKDIIYVVQKGDKFAHGKTIKEAKKSLIYKVSDRDTARFKDWTLDTKVNLEDAVASYISITGACKMFVDSLKEIPKIITPRVIIELTEGQYECDVYKEFFKGVEK